nr:family 20 glycosylhydrolase [Acidobacteriota bacterium]
MRTWLPALSVGLLLLTATTVSAQQIVPQPVKLTPHDGRFAITERTVISTDAASAAAGHQLARYLEPATGITFRVVSSGTVPTRSISLRRDRSLTRLGEEGYLLDVRPGGVTVRAPGAAGLFYAVQTIRQLLPPAIFREAPAGAVEWSMPAVTIEDFPRFQWRGGHLDVARHFMPKEFVKKYIDLLALHKMNVFHWHLTEDQGWRLEIKQYPKLTEVGAWRKETLVGRARRGPTEVLAIFPGRYIHIGGDEADKAKWKTSERIQARIKELRLKDEHELQSWFIRQMDDFFVS